MMRKKMFIAEDGHKLESKYEKIIDDTLYERGIHHDAHEKIPGSNYRCDFKVGDVFVEVWGLETEEYEEERKRS